MNIYDIIDLDMSLQKYYQTHIKLPPIHIGVKIFNTNQRGIVTLDKQMMHTYNSLRIDYAMYMFDFVIS